MHLVSLLPLVFLSFATATPLFQRRSPKLITLPVKIYHHEPLKDLHPLIFFEQVLNRGLQRFARMSGSPELPRQVLERNLMRRVLQVEGPAGLERRFNRRTLDDTVLLEKRFYPAESPTAASRGSILAVGDDDVPADLAVTPANPPNAPNSIGLDIEANDLSYLATVEIGTPPRNFSIVVDSGSSDLWVGSQNCKSPDLGRDSCGNHVFLGPDFSSSFVDSGKPWGIKYGLGSVNGTLVNDNIKISGFTLANHAFGVANSESKEFAADRVSFDGIMGLGRSRLSNQNNLTPVDALAKEGLIDAAIVSYSMGRVRDNVNNGAITFGGLDETKFDPNTGVTVPNISPFGFWEANTDDIAVDGTSLGLKNRTAILDTGTTLIIAPLDDTLTLLQAVPGFVRSQGAFLIPCNTTAVVSLTFGGVSFDIDPRDLAFAPLAANGGFEAGLCRSGITAGEIFGDTTWLVGATFLKNVYFSTDDSKNTMFLAKAVG